jgi:molecular chaperone GrpE
MHDQQSATDTPFADSAGMTAGEPVTVEQGNGVTEASATQTAEHEGAALVEEPALEAELAQQRQQAAAYLDQLQRLQAEFQNYRRRATQERQQATSRGKEDVLRALMPILANFHLALQHAEQDASAVRQGVQMIWQQFEGFIRDQNMERIPTVGEQFDPTRHEVLSTVPATAETPANTIVNEVKAGYFLDGRLLCPAQVVVAQALAEAVAPEVSA